MSGRTAGATAARTARAALAAAPCATLEVRGLGCPVAEVLLLEQDGRPLFFCPANSPVPAAAAGAARAALSVPAGRGCAVLHGRLRPSAVQEVDGEPVHVLTLELDEIALDGEPVPLDSYLADTGSSTSV